MSKSAAEKAEKAVNSTIDKYKKRMKRVCVCGTLWMLTGIIAIVIGILFLVYYSKYWDDTENWRRKLAQSGVGLLIIGLIFIIIGVVFVVILYVLYKRINKGQTHVFTPPNYKYGEAPYPQQPPWPPEGGQQAPSAPPQSGAPPMPTAPVDDGEVHVEVSSHEKF
ncbi:hypothetical protein CAPTEDRAFT_219738 [Capitella teleta]|uniref:Uncharacterized protein n=1 Tax=Capitella teleta TaxID=283909 RepID=R7T7N6_CAPTE|nr:hypothetical protein CAPTEDRAFT_219738 [Capitella teleta]|eukprot:ELT89443.1 hypothetical protein CAPTEDRAFT_219738 [Capitella teleta]